MGLLSIFFLIVVVVGAYLVWRNFFRNEDARAEAAQNDIVDSGMTQATLNRRVQRRGGRYYDHNNNLIEDLFLIALLNDLIFDQDGYSYPDESLYEQATICASATGEGVGASVETETVGDDGLTDDERNVQSAVAEDTTEPVVSTPEPVSAPVVDSTPSYSSDSGSSYDSSDSGGGGGSDD